MLPFGKTISDICCNSQWFQLPHRTAAFCCLPCKHCSARASAGGWPTHRCYLVCCLGVQRLMCSDIPGSALVNKTYLTMFGPI